MEEIGLQYIYMNNWNINKIWRLVRIKCMEKLSICNVKAKIINLYSN